MRISSALLVLSKTNTEDPKQGTELTSNLDTIFPGSTEKLLVLRKQDAGFDEICTHFEIILTEMTKTFGPVEGAAVDLIVSFEDLRREIERLLRAPLNEKTGSP